MIYSSNITRISQYILCIMTSAELAYAHPDVSGIWQEIGGDAVEIVQVGDSVTGKDLSTGQVILKGVIDESGAIQGHKLGFLEEGFVREACPEWANGWQEMDLALSRDGSSLEGLFIPLRIERNGLFNVCLGPEDLPVENLVYEKLFATDENCVFPEDYKKWRTDINEAVVRYYSHYTHGLYQTYYYTLGQASAIGSKALLQKYYDLIAVEAKWVDMSTLKVEPSGTPQFDLVNDDMLIHARLNHAEWAISKVWITTTHGYEGWETQLWYRDGPEDDWSRLDSCTADRSGCRSANNDLIIQTDLLPGVASLGKVGAQKALQIAVRAGTKSAAIQASASAITLSRLMALSRLSKRAVTMGGCRRAVERLGSLTKSIADKFVLRGVSPATKANQSLTPGAKDLLRRYGPHQVGPLTEEIAITFRGGSYTARTLAQPRIYFRVWSSVNRSTGGFWADELYYGVQAQVDNAVSREWNHMSRFVVIEVPRGVTVYEGYSASQSWWIIASKIFPGVELRSGNLLGGGFQAFIPNVDPKWIVSTGKL